MRNIWRLLKELNLELSFDPAILLLVIYLKEYKLGNNKGTCTLIIIEALFTILSCRNSQDAPVLMNGLRKCGIYMKWNFHSTTKNNEIL
jgi:hypothetical protein